MRPSSSIPKSRAKTSLKSLGEFGLIARVTKGLSAKPHWSTGLGDDGAVLKISSHHYQILTHDLCLENVHFLAKSKQDLVDAGFKALAVNLSDVAAMGGSPLGAVVGLGIPAYAQVSEVEALYDGLKQCAKAYDCSIVGGDTNASKHGWVIAVTVLGKCTHPPKLRSGTKPDDSLWVTGNLGTAALGWEARKQKNFSQQSVLFRKLHARPKPRLKWGKKLGSSSWVSAMMDVSDGLAGDLKRMAEASGVGFGVEIEKIPRVRNFTSLAQKLNLEESQLLLSGGEDYELLFTVSSQKTKFMASWLAKNNIQAHCIGQATTSKGLYFLGLSPKQQARLKGFEHF